MTGRLAPLVAVACLVSAACEPPFFSGRGSGTEVVPAPASPTAPTPATPVFTFTGRVTTTQGGAPVSGATVAVDGASATSGGDGAFSVAIGAASAAAVTVRAPGFLTRTTTLAGGQSRSGGTIDLIATEPSFDLDFFDRLARGKDQPEFPGHVLRWPTNPRFYVITRVTSFQDGAWRSTAQEVPTAVLNRIERLLPGLVGAATGGRLQAAELQFRPDARETFESGWIQVEVADRPSGGATDECGFGGLDIAFAGNGFTNEVRRTGFMRMYLTDNCRCANDVPSNIILAHELGHALGFAHTHPHRDSVLSYQTSVACSTPNFSPRDQYHGALAYARPVGNASPDTDPDGFQLLRFSRARNVHFAVP